MASEAVGLPGTGEVAPAPATRRDGMILAVRVLHSAFAVFFLSCLGYVYWAAFARRRNRRLAVAAVALVGEGAVVAANGGNCPLGPIHLRYGDERTFFGLFLPPRLARGAVPFFAAVTVLGFLLAAARPPEAGPGPGERARLILGICQGRLTSLPRGTPQSPAAPVTPLSPSAGPLPSK